MLNLIPDFEPAVTPKVANTGSGQGTKGGAPFAAQLERETAGRGSVPGGKKGIPGAQGKRSGSKMTAAAPTGHQGQPAAGNQASTAPAAAAGTAAPDSQAGKGATATSHRDKPGKSTTHEGKDSAAPASDPGQAVAAQPAGQPVQPPVVPAPQPPSGPVDTGKPAGASPSASTVKTAAAVSQELTAVAMGEQTAAHAAASGSEDQPATTAGRPADPPATATQGTTGADAVGKVSADVAYQPVTPVSGSTQELAAQSKASGTPAQPAADRNTNEADAAGQASPQPVPAAADHAAATGTPGTATKSAAASPAAATAQPAAKTRQSSQADATLQPASPPANQPAAPTAGSVQTAQAKPPKGAAEATAVEDSAAMPAGESQPERQGKTGRQAAPPVAAPDLAAVSHHAGPQPQVQSHATAEAAQGAAVQAASNSSGPPADVAVAQPSTVNAAAVTAAAVTTEPADTAKPESGASAAAQSEGTAAFAPAAAAQNSSAQGLRRKPHDSATPSEIAFFGFDPTAPQVSNAASVASGTTVAAATAGTSPAGAWQRGETLAADGRSRQGQSGQATVTGSAGSQPAATGFVTSAAAGQNLDAQSGGQDDQPRGETPAQQATVPQTPAEPATAASAEHLAAHLAAAENGKPDQVPDPGQAAASSPPAATPAAQAGMVQAMAQAHDPQHPQALGKVAGERHETSSATVSQAVPQHLQGVGNRSAQDPQVQQAKPAAAPLPLHDSQIADQVVSRISLSQTADEHRLTVTLHPKDLGEVKIEVVNGKDGLRAHLQTQNQQVQDALEKHLPRLREAFHQQGLKLQQLQVSCDARRDGGSSFQQSQQHFSQRQPAPQPGALRAVRLENEWTTPSPPAQVPGGRQGISLRI